MYIPIPTWLYFFTAFFILQAREIIKGAEDVEGDELRDVRTIARVYGYKTAAIVAAILNFIGVACYVSIWLLQYARIELWLLLILGSTVVTGAGIAPLTGPDNKKRLMIGSTLDKIGALIGLIAFVVIPFYAIFY
jgi:geranylgeranylglycerol-phosphate geranylgeranyltransferase